MKEVKLPTKTALRISTLSSLTDLCTGKFGEPIAGFEKFDNTDHVVHVMSPTQVQVVTARSNAWAQREVLIDCILTETTPFPLSSPQKQTWLTQDEFIIALLSSFVPSDERANIAKLAGNATAEMVTTSQDDGVSQQVGVRSGAHLADQVNVKNIVRLQLYRTFREVDQPSSDFLFRLKQSGENIPQFAFFEADGGSWKLAALDNIRRFLNTRMGDATIVS